MRLCAIVNIKSKGLRFGAWSIMALSWLSFIHEPPNSDMPETLNLYIYAYIYTCMNVYIYIHIHISVYILYMYVYICSDFTWILPSISDRSNMRYRVLNTQEIPD